MQLLPNVFNAFSKNHFVYCKDESPIYCIVQAKTEIRSTDVHCRTEVPLLHCSKYQTEQPTQGDSVQGTKAEQKRHGYVSSVSSELKYPGYNVYCTAYRAVPWLQSTEHSRAGNKKRSIGCQGQGHSETSLLMHTFTLILFIYI